MAPFLGYFATVALATFGLGIATPSVGLRLAEAGIAGGTVGLVLAAYNLGVVATGLLGSGWLARWGAKRGLRTAGLLLAASLMIQATTSGLLLLAAARILAGAAFAFSCLAVEAGIGRMAGARRGAALGAYLAVANAAQCAGTMLASPSSEVIAVAAGLVLLTWVSAGQIVAFETTRPAGPSLDLRLLLARAPGAAVAAVSGGAAVGALAAVGPMYGVALGLNGTWLVAFLTALAGMGALIPPVLGNLADRRGYDRLILATVLLVSGASLFGAVVGKGPAAIAAVCIASGLAYALYPLGVGLAQCRLSSDEFGRAAGGILIAYAAGATIGGPVAGLLVDRVGAPALPLWLAFASASAVLGPAARALAARRAAASLLARSLTR